MTAITIACDNWNPLESYGQIATVLAWKLSREFGVHVNAITGPRPFDEVSCPVTRGLLQEPCRPPDGTIVLGYPTLIRNYDRQLASGPRVAVTMFESTALPDGWLEALEECRAVVVPSSWLVDVFRKAGVTAPIHVAPLGVSSTYRFVPRPASRRPFTFLMIASPGLRKGWDVAVRAFDEAFGADERYRLIIKLRAGRRLGVRIVHPQVEILAADIDEAGMQELYASVDAFLCPSRGEGFGLPPREAAATGLPVIATNWGGTADHIHEWGTPLSCSLSTAWPHHRDHPRCGHWAEPDVAELARLMQNLANSAFDAVAAEERSRRVTARYDWGRFTATVWEIWREAAGVPAGGGISVREQPPGREVERPADTPTSLPRPRKSPRFIIHAHPDISWHGRFVQAASMGLRALGLSFLVTSRPVRGDAGLPILLGTTCWRAIETVGPYLLVDRCSYGDPGRFVSLVRDGHGRRGDHRVPEVIDGSRWERHPVDVLPWKPGGTHVILCGQTETYSPHYRCTRDWYATVAGMCSTFRRHPASRSDPAVDGPASRLPLARSWENCGLAVTLNSSVAVEAVLAGVPTVTMDEAAMAWDVTGHRMHEIITPDRTSWLHWLAWTQWSYDEIEEGVPWPRFLD